MDCALVASLIAIASATQAPAQNAQPVQMPAVPATSAPAPNAPSESTAAVLQPPAAKPAPGAAGGSTDAALGLKYDAPAPNLVAMPVARVGREEITSYDIESQLAEWQFANNAAIGAHVSQLIAQGMKPRDAEREVIAIRNQVRKDILDTLIDRKVVLQAARHKAKDQKSWDYMLKQIDKAFAEDKLPHLLKIYNAKDEIELRKKLTKDHRSLDDIKENYRLDEMMREVMRMAIRDKINPTYPQKLEYYWSHLKDYEAPAHVTWRELAAVVDEKTPRAAARRKADTWLARLRRGEDFARVATAESQGATASKGGLWDKMLPNSYGVPAVNAALERVPVGQISQVIEGDNGYYIVRVEDRRAAGPKRFDEVQSQVHQAVFQAAIQRESVAFINKLRAKTVVISYFESPQGDNQVKRTSATQTAPK